MKEFSSFFWVLLLVFFSCSSPLSQKRERILETKEFNYVGKVVTKARDSLNWGATILVVEVDTSKCILDSLNFDLLFYSGNDLKRLSKPYWQGVENLEGKFFFAQNHYYCSLFDFWNQAEKGDTVEKRTGSLEYILRKPDTVLYFYPDCVPEEEWGPISNPARQGP